MGSFWNNLGLALEANLLPFFFACLEFRDKIYQISVFFAMFTNFEGLSMNSSLAITLQTYLLLGNLACLGETLRRPILNLYWITSDMEYELRTIEDISSAPNYIGFESI